VYGGSGTVGLLVTADEIAANTITANEIAANTITGTEISSLNISTKTITADTGTIGGWTLSASSLSSGSVSFDATTERLLMGAASAPLTGAGVFLGKDSADYEFRCGDPAGSYLHWDGTSLTLKSPVVNSPAAGSSPSILGWAHDVAFSATDNDTVAWGTGTISLADGATTYSIVAGNTGNMTASTTYYVYLDTDTSTTVLQSTTTASSAVGANKILVAVCRPATAGTDATFMVYGGSGDVGISQTVNLGSQVSGTLTSAFADAGLINSNVTINADGSLSGAGAGQASLTSLPGQVQVGSIAANAVTSGTIAALAVTAAKIAANTITASQIAANTITASEIAANTITSNEIAANTITASEISAGTITTTELATGTLAAGNIEAGTIIIASVVIATTSFTAANPVFDGSVAIEGGDGYKRVELTATGNYGAITFYDSAAVNETGSIWGSASYGLRLAAVDGNIHFEGSSGLSYGLRLAAVDGNIHFEGSSGFSSLASAVLYNNGDIWGPKECDGVLVGTGASTSYTTLKTESWTGDGSFIGTIVEFAGNVTGTNAAKGVRITAGGTSAVLFEPAAGDTGAWHVKVMIAPITTSSQRVYAVWTDTNGTTGVYRSTRSINTVTTTFTLTLDGRTVNSSDEVECDLMISRSMANDGT
jgi:hypothetical protein